jgi:hypothetical protein
LLLCCAAVQLAALQTVSSSDAQAITGVPTDEVLAAAVSFPPGSVSKMEENIKAALSSDTKSISMLRTLKLYLERMGTDKQQVSWVGAGAGLLCCAAKAVSAWWIALAVRKRAVWLAGVCKLLLILS